MIINRKEFVKAIDKCSTVIGKNMAVPIIENVLVKFTKGQVKVMATNLEVTMISVFEFNSDEEMIICINPKLVKDFLSQLQVDVIDLTVTQSKDLTQEKNTYNGSVVFEYGLGSIMEFPLYDPDDFPTFPEMKEVTSKMVLDGEVFKDLLANLRGFTGFDDLRPIMSSIQFIVTSETIRATATNAVVLQTQIRKAMSEVPSGEETFLINNKVIPALLKLGNKPLTMHLTDTNVFIATPDTVLAFLNTIGNYPNWLAVIPQNYVGEIVFNREEFLKGIKLSSISASNDSPVIKMKVDGTKLEMSSSDPDFRKRGVFKMNLESSTADVVVGMSSKVLKQCIDATPEVDHLKLNVNVKSASTFGKKDMDGEDTRATLILLMPSMIVGEDQ